MKILTRLWQFEVKGVSDAAYRGETIYKWEMKVTAWQQVLTSILRPILQSEVPDSDVDTGNRSRTRCLITSNKQYVTIVVILENAWKEGQERKSAFK